MEGEEGAIFMKRLATALIFFTAPSLSWAGLHYSGEVFAELPSRWAGMLMDYRALRQAANSRAATLLGQQYRKEAARLSGLGRELTPDEAADLGALWVRLGEEGKAIEVLQPAARRHPEHFRLAANLGTALQVAGRLPQAAAALEQAVRLAPARYVRDEKLHLRLVRLRAREKEPGGLDDLFGVVWLPATPERVKKLPTTAIASAQQLALWLPGDGRLLWLLGELAGAHGDQATRAAILEGCVSEMGMRQDALLASRKEARAAAAALKGSKKEHESHAWLFKPRSARPLPPRALLDRLPPIDARGVNSLPWEVVMETTLDRRARPTFHRYLRDLDGKRVVVEGYMQPVAEGTDLGAFLLIESPVGCWYCEQPELTGLVLIELPDGKAGSFTRSRIKVTGTLALNGTDPENFLYIIKDARAEKAPED
jgi:tetratricopeptide (TPR) repeat protein